jgi:PadR family transcriptional regulator AphA
LHYLWVWAILIYIIKIYINRVQCQKKNRTKYAVLGLLSLKPLSGYDIKKMTEHSIGFFWSENFGAIYPLLKDLEQNELATKSIEKQDGKPDRKVYTITDAGKKELEQWLCSPIGPEYLREELLLKLFFGNEVPIQESIERLKETIKRHQILLDQYSQITRHFAESDMPVEKIKFYRITLNFGIKRSQMIIAWSQESIAQLQAMAKDQVENR